MENQLEMNEKRIRLFETFKQVFPEVGSAVRGCDERHNRHSGIASRNRTAR
jgi:hypothetical protein